MNVRIIFGSLFFLLSIIFCVFQIITLLISEHLEGAQLILQFCSAWRACCSPRSLFNATRGPLRS